jgi:hypothetical protein
MDRPSLGGRAVTRPLLDPNLADGGARYFDEEDETPPSPDALDAELAADLWSVSLEALGLPEPDA